MSPVLDTRTLQRSEDIQVGMPRNYPERGLALRKRSEPVAWIQDSWRSGCGPCHVRG